MEKKWPTEWRKGECMTIFKDWYWDPNNVRNYRPITVLNALNKIFEKLHVLTKQKTDHYDKMLWSIVSNCLQEMKWMQNISFEVNKRLESGFGQEREGSSLCYGHMSKAFDSLNNKILLQKLSCYWLFWALYPTNQIMKNRVRIDSVVNEWKETTRGCPQGSSFGPLLWNFYQSDLTFLLKNIKLSSWCMSMTTNCTPLEKTPNIWKRT